MTTLVYPYKPPICANFHHNTSTFAWFIASASARAVGTQASNTITAQSHGMLSDTIDVSVTLTWEITNTPVTVDAHGHEWVYRPDGTTLNDLDTSTFATGDRASVKRYYHANVEKIY